MIVINFTIIFTDFGELEIKGITHRIYLISPKAKKEDMSSSKFFGGERWGWGSCNAQPSEGERFSILLRIYTDL